MAKLTKKDKAVAVAASIVSKSQAKRIAVQKEAKRAKLLAKLPTTITPEKRANLLDAFERSLLCKLKFHKVSNDRFIPNEKIEVKGDDEVKTARDSVHAYKRIMASEEYDLVMRRTREIVHYMEDNSVRSTLDLDAGMYVVPIVSVKRVDKEIRARMKLRQEAVEDLASSINKIKASDKKRLGPLFDEYNYPTGAEIKERFYVTYQYIDAAVPGRLKTIDAQMFEIQDRERQELNVRAAQQFESLLRMTFRDLVAGLHERLTGKTEDGKPKVLRDAAVENIREFISSFGERNLTSDRELAEHVASMEKLLGGVDVDQFHGKTAEEYRAVIATQIKKVTTALDGLVEAAPVRKFRRTNGE